MTRSYRPSNGTEGEFFQSAWCFRCANDSDNNPCEILDYTMAFSINDPDYPKQWIYGDDGKPKCTAFVLGPPIRRLECENCDFEQTDVEDGVDECPRCLSRRIVMSR